MATQSIWKDDIHSSLIHFYISYLQKAHSNKLTVTVYERKYYIFYYISWLLQLAYILQKGKVILQNKIPCTSSQKQYTVCALWKS